MRGRHEDLAPSFTTRGGLNKFFPVLSLGYHIYKEGFMIQPISKASKQNLLWNLSISWLIGSS